MFVLCFCLKYALLLCLEFRVRVAYIVYCLLILLAFNFGGNGKTGGFGM